MGLTENGLGWHCFRCDAGGDAVTLAAFALAGTDRPPNWRVVREGLQRAALGGALPPPLRTPPERVPDARPPRRDVLGLWAACRPLCEDSGAAAWAHARGLDPVAVSDRDLARALPVDATVPAWMSMRGVAWPAAGYRVIVPMYDARGVLSSLHARNVDADVEPKGAFAAGYAVAGLVIADDPGRVLLKSQQLAGSLWIVEGVPDYLTAATHWGDAAVPWPAVVGIVSGSWTGAVAARVPDGARVVIAVHRDKAGLQYRKAIMATLVGRVRLHEWLPPDAGRAMS